jgi:hypothetical protein
MDRSRRGPHSGFEVAAWKGPSIRQQGDEGSSLEAAGGCFNILPYTATVLRGRLGSGGSWPSEVTNSMYIYAQCQLM